MTTRIGLGKITYHYWHITGLSGTPFLQGEGSEHDITITSVVGSTGHTTVSIVVKEQYLNSTLDIQCGLCSVVFPDPVCGSADRLSENITSTSVKLVSVGNDSNMIYYRLSVLLNHFNTISGSSPRGLHSSPVSNGVVTLYWSPPLTPSDYSCSVPDNECFSYTVTLSSTNNTTQTVSFTTSGTSLSISRLNITSGLDTCAEYSWSVIATNGGFESEDAVANESLILQTS